MIQVTAVKETVFYSQITVLQITAEFLYNAKCSVSQLLNIKKIS